VAKALNSKIEWRVWGSRHRVRALLWLVSSPVVFSVVVAAVGSIDGATNAKHPTTIQNAVIGVSLILGCAVGATMITVGVRHFHRYAVAGTKSFVVVANKKRVVVQYEAITDVVVTDVDGSPNDHQAALVVNGLLIPIVRSRSTRVTGPLGRWSIDATVSDSAADRAVSVAVATRQLVPILTVPRSVAAATPATFMTFAAPIISSAPVATTMTRSATPPPNAAVTMTDREAGNGRALFSILPAILVVFALITLRIQSNPNQPTNWGRLGALVALAFVILLVCQSVALFWMVAELRVGSDWLAVRRKGRRTWKVLRREGLVGVTGRLQGQRNRRYATSSLTIPTSIRFGDCEGSSITLSSRWLVPKIDTALHEAMNDRSLWDGISQIGTVADPKATFGES
jgi:hypothetical protein